MCRNEFIFLPMHRPPPQSGEPPTLPFDSGIHACVWAARRALNAAAQKHKVYDYEQDGEINWRQILQSTAKMYGVDTSDMLGYYPHILDYLTYPGIYTPPASIETAMANKREAVRNTDGHSVKVH
jgi:hypothetical protein